MTEQTPQGGLYGPQSAPDDSRAAEVATEAGDGRVAGRCTHCKGSGADPNEEGDYDCAVHRHNPFTVPPCPVCLGTGKTAAEGAAQ